MGADFGVETGFSCPDIARAPPANAPPAATFFKNSRRSKFPFFRLVVTSPSHLAPVWAALWSHQANDEAAPTAGFDLPRHDVQPPVNN